MSMISKRSRYALHGLAYIAAFSRGEHIPFNELLSYLRAYSNKLTLSPGYIAKIFQDISRAGFTEAISGPRGGYQLTRPAGQIRLIEILEALDGPLLTDCCLLSVGTCSREDACGVQKFIHEAEESFYLFFQRETLASLAERMTFPDPSSIASRRTGAARAKQPRRLVRIRKKTRS